MENKKNKAKSFNFGNKSRHYVLKIIRSKIFIMCAFLVVLMIISFIFDKQIIKFFSLIHLSFLNSIIEVFFKIQEHYAFYTVIFIIGGLFIFFKKKKEHEFKNIIKFIITFVVVIVVELVLKAIIFRPRPNLSSFNSFPSGHAAITFTPLWFIKNKTLWIIWFILSVLVAFSRLYIQVHYTSDIFAGILISYITSIIFIKFLKIKRNGN